MCNQERASVIAIITSLLTNGFILTRYLQLSSAGALTGPDATMIWARVVLWMIPAAIVLTIVLNVLFSISMRERLLDSTADERDRLFQLRGMHVMAVVFGIGFVGAMAGLASGWVPLTGFIVIWIGAALGDLSGNVVRIASYRLGS